MEKFIKINYDMEYDEIEDNIPDSISKEVYTCEGNTKWQIIKNIII